MAVPAGAEEGEQWMAQKVRLNPIFATAITREGQEKYTLKELREEGEMAHGTRPRSSVLPMVLRFNQQ